MSADSSRYARRALTIPAVVGGFLLGLTLAPLAFPGCLLVDLARRKRTLPTTRLAGFSNGELAERQRAVRHRR